jgi:hypothetical protein
LPPPAPAWAGCAAARRLRALGGLRARRAGCAPPASLRGLRRFWTCGARFVSAMPLLPTARNHHKSKID